MGQHVYTGLGGRHGDRAVERSTLFPSLDQPMGLVIVNAPHLEVYPYVVIYGALALRLVSVTICLDADVHPLQGYLVASGYPFHHVNRAGGNARQE